MWLFPTSSILAQKSSSEDSVRLLNEVIVKAYASDRSIQEVPAAIGVLKESDLNRFSPSSILPAVNMVPGVRMEERSPGSYRFSIRGSTLRAPFGVRNVKFYWNGLPLTDGGGNTYLNLIDFSSIGNMEIIKGPGGSLYGAGTGGVALLSSPGIARSDLRLSLMTGSYGLFRFQTSVALAPSKKFQLQLGIGAQKSDGYRQQTNMERVMTSITWRNVLSAKSFLSGTFFATNLYYQTPGGLTEAQYDQDPQQARPTTSPTSPGAVDQKAAVKNQTGYLGLSFDHTWNEKWFAQIGIFGSATNFENPAIRNYEKRKEENWGGRADAQYKFENSSIKGKITLGAEYQHFYSPVSVFENLLGNSGKLQISDILRSQIAIGFAQAELDLSRNFYLTLGASGNFINYKFLRTSVSPEVNQERNFNPVVSPRIALLKKISPDLSVYGSISRGFSPPSLAEVRPSTGAFNNSLNAERGTSYEVGLKAKVLQQLQATLALYDFRLQEAIVIQRDASGADYFVNAGSTTQQGAELMLGWTPVFSTAQAAPLRVWASYTYNHYYFDEYINDGKDFSGNALTGISPSILVFGVDMKSQHGFYFNVTGNYSERLPLNDAGTDHAADYFLLGGRAGYQWALKTPLEFFVGVDNALDRRYSLGNDINATSGRYYNAASGRNYYAGLAFRLNLKPPDN